MTLHKESDSYPIKTLRIKTLIEEFQQKPKQYRVTEDFSLDIYIYIFESF